MQADLVQVAATLEAGHAPLDDQQADALVARVRIGPGHHDDQVAELAIGDEGLLAVEDVASAVADGGGADSLQVAAGTRLAHRDGRDELTRAVPGEPAVALLGRAQTEQVLAVDVVVHGEPGSRGARPGQFLVEDQVVPVVRVSPAAMLLVDVDAEQAGPAGGQPDVPGDHAVPLPLLVVRGDLPADERAHHVPERFVLGGEDVPPHRRTSLL
jgi:hypothetical protein